MRTIIILVFGLFLAGMVQDKVGLPADLSAIAILAPGEALAQVGSSISADGSAPNNNAMLDVKSPTTGDGKGMLIPRVTLAQRTTASSALAGGLLDNSGNLRGGAAQGLIVYQTDGVQGLYFNASSTAAPNWVHLGEGSDLDMQGKVITNAVYYGDGRGITNLSAGAYTETDPQWATASNSVVADIAVRLASNVWAVAGSTTNYLPRTGGTMSGALNMGAQIVSNVTYIDFNGNYVSVGRGANGVNSGAALGYQANGSDVGAALGYLANGYSYGAALGRSANGFSFGAAMGYMAIGTTYGAAMGYSASGTNYGAAMGRQANGNSLGAAMGAYANASSLGAALGYAANGTDAGAAVGYSANSYVDGAAVGYLANGVVSGAAVGRAANGSFEGVAIGQSATGSYSGAALGYAANGNNSGVAVGWEANSYSSGAALGYQANGARTNVAIGAYADAQGGTERIAIGHNVTNAVNNSAAIRGTLYLDGGTGINYRATFGSGAWANKAFEIDHPLDPENKILRHFCLEGPQVWNVYAGNAQLVNGQAKVQLPDYYSALNLAGSEIYSLTPIGEALVWIDSEVSGNCFIIAGKRDIKVSWTVKVLRNDPGCLEDLRRRPVEQRRSELETGN